MLAQGVLSTLAAWALLEVLCTLRSAFPYLFCCAARSCCLSRSYQMLGLDKPHLSFDLHHEARRHFKGTYMAAGGECCTEPLLNLQLRGKAAGLYAHM